MGKFYVLQQNKYYFRHRNEAGALEEIQELSFGGLLWVEVTRWKEMVKNKEN